MYYVVCGQRQRFDDVVGDKHQTLFSFALFCNRAVFLNGCQIKRQPLLYSHLFAQSEHDVDERRAPLMCTMQIIGGSLLPGMR